MTKWDTRFLTLARHIATWSKDPSTQVGAVIARPDKSIASVGFNGFPRSVTDSADRLTNRDTKLKYTVHAEPNAILHAREPLHSYTLYVWPFMPCAQCAAVIIQAGITRVVYPATTSTRWQNSWSAAHNMFREANVAQTIGHLPYE